MYLANDALEPPGKPIVVVCRKVQVALELAAPDDQRVLGERGLAAMRRQRLARQAQLQGGLLTVEDVAQVTCSSTVSD